MASSCCSFFGGGIVPWRHAIVSADQVISNRGLNMFSVRQKREIADKIQQILRDTGHPELPDHEIPFVIKVAGATPWSFAEIKNNSAVPNPDVNPHNERMDSNNDY